MKKKMFMETTTVPASRSIASIEDCLVRAGAAGIMKQYAIGGSCTSLRFSLRVGGHECPFELPARVEPVFQRLKKKQTSYRSRKSEADMKESAERIAWRQLFRWVEAQVALIDTGMVQAAEPFLAYQWNPNTGQTMFQAFEGAQKLPPAPEVG